MLKDNSETLVKVENLKTWFPIQKGVLRRVCGHVKAVDNVSFSIPRGKTLGLVGESGCGKTTVGRTMLRLIEPTDGNVFYNDKNVFKQNHSQMKKLRKEMQIVFQDPYGSLNPRMTVGGIVGESLRVHTKLSGSQCRDMVGKVLEQVGLSAAYVNRYPHEFSGGQRQRIGIARALAPQPRFIVCDEPVSALDVSIQSQIVNLLQDLQEKMGLTYLFIAHDLAVIEHISDLVAVMYLGKIVEYTYADELYANPLHPYTKALMAAIPRPQPKRAQQRIPLQGEVPSPSNPPSGCHFHPRCPFAEEKCKNQVQELAPKDADTEHLAACWKAKIIKEQNK